MKISLIAAMADDRVIGINNALPWKLPADMQWFRKHTLGKPIIMGRKTFESFGGRTLPDRTNIVITRDKSYHVEGDVIIVHDIAEALAAAGDVDEVMIIGGASFYAQMLPRADRFYVTRVHGSFEGDAWFPDYEGYDWKEISREEHAVDDKNAYACTFLVLEK
jgi:dihydrofolate reductase